MVRKVIDKDPKLNNLEEELKKVNEAINRDRLIYESKKEEINGLLSEEKIILERLDELGATMSHKE